MMNRPRVTLYSFSFGHHGRYSSLHRLLDYSDGCAIVDATPPPLGWLGPRWRRSLEFRWFRLSEWRLRRVFARRQKQCVHYIHPENSLFLGARWKAGHALVLTCHQPGSLYRDGRPEDVNQRFVQGLKRADRVVLLTRCFCKDYEALCDPSRLRVIPHGVDTEFFHPAGTRKSRPLVLTIGNWLRDYDFWAEMALQLARERPEVEFAVVAQPAVISQARAHVAGPLGRRVRFLSGLTDGQLSALYREATLLFLPLRDAGANNALLEAMASGLPLLVTDLPATREYAGECGCFFPVGNQQECLAKLQQLLQEAGRREELGCLGRQRAVRDFSWKTIAKRYAEIYAGVLEDSPAGRF